MDNLTVVYMITRSDGMQYIGISQRFYARMREHIKSARFREGIRRIDTLLYTKEYSYAEEMESYFISRLDTYNNGLNVTPNGKGNTRTASFNTKGFHFSRKSRELMSKRGKERYQKYGVWNEGKCHSEKTKKKLSEKRIGITWSPRKISENQSLDIYQSFANDIIHFDNEFVRSLVKPRHKDLVGNVPHTQLKLKSGKPVTKLVLYCHYFANLYGVTSAAIRKIINKEGITAPSYAKS